VPVTAKLSRKFYEKFGDDLANELVDWFNMVDATYRSELRELNELNYARFDAKLEQRVAELRSDIQVGLERLETRLTKRLFGFWVAQAATTAALVFGVVKLVHEDHPANFRSLSSTFTIAHVSRSQ
jgi:cytochrome c-type biogenesis protein CcmH/NrfG